MSALLNPFWGSTAPFTGPDWDNVVLLMGFNGSDGSTSFVDESQYHRSATAVGNAQIDTAITKFGSGSLLLDGSADCVQLPQFVFDKDGGSQSIEVGFDFQIEAWIRFAASADLGIAHCLLSRFNTAFNNRSWVFQYTGSALEFINYANGTNSPGTAVSAAWSPSVQTWYHVAFSRVAGVSRAFVDGQVLGESSALGDFTDFGLSNAPVRIGAQNNAVENSFNGHMDEVRIVVYENGDGDTKLYTASFAPPTAAFPRS